MIKLNDYVVQPTIFPDGTSQVWKIPEEILQSVSVVTWEFENEAELSHVMQLGYLLKTYDHYKIYLNVPFMPYGRQDKQISNNATFARNVIVKILKSVFDEIQTIDNHSEDIFVRSKKPDMTEIFLACKPDVICYPDLGASKRGYDRYFYPTIILDKDRDQLTGEIKGLKFEADLGNSLVGKSILIQDDLTDGGRTFIEACKLLKGAGAKEVYLYTTHGIYSKGTKVLFDAGIDRIFNRKGEVKNEK